MSFKLKIFQPEYIFCLVLVCMTACKKQEPVTLQFPDHIAAGDMSGQQIHHSEAGIEHHHNNNSGAWQWEIDINNDGSTDCVLIYYAAFSKGSYTVRLSIRPASLPVCEIAASDKYYNFAYAIPANTIIDQNMRWVTNECIMYYYNHYSNQSPTIYGQWSGSPGNKYLGVRSKVDDHFIYGWINIEIYNFKLRFIDFACTSGY